MHDLDLRLWQGRFREYLTIVRAMAIRTVEAYTAELKPLLEYLERQGLGSFGRLTRAHLEGYRLELFERRYRNKPLSASTLATRLGAVKSFARFLYRDNYTLLDLSHGFEIPARGRQIPRVILSERDTFQLLEFPDIGTMQGIRDRTLLELFYGTGIRNTELRLLRLDQVDLERSLLRVDHGKGDKPRVLPLGEEALAWLEEYLAKVRPLLVRSSEQQLLFLNVNGAPLTRHWMAARIRRVAKDAGLDKTVTPHVLRHSIATHMLRRGANIRHLQSLLGHADLDSTQIYTRVEVSDLAKVIERYHPRERDHDVR